MGCSIFTLISVEVPSMDLQPALFSIVSLFIVDPATGLLVTVLIVTRLLHIRRRHRDLFDVDQYEIHRGIQRRTLEPPTATPNQISTLRFNRGLSTQPDIEELIVPPPGQPLPGLSMNTSEYMVLARPPAQPFLSLMIKPGTRIRDHRSQDIVVVVPEAVQ
ncbi:hypothetical protein D9756_006819 [Leucocoprinus leucothites]|uniref:Uncharacterized protein n=1 Tax=Leucocoprinus leucothites TaxID=201217 RepID=A0A8H5G2F4_9AGAR|nr:hypothetical protein D9756_006819 [Leucoagaricus leucothites]